MCYKNPIKTPGPKKNFLNIKTQSSYLENCVFKRGTIIYNKFVMNGQYSQYLKNDHKCDKAKQILKQYFFQLVFKEPKCSMHQYLLYLGKTLNLNKNVFCLYIASTLPLIFDRYMNKTRWKFSVLFFKFRDTLERVFGPIATSVGK